MQSPVSGRSENLRAELVGNAYQKQTSPGSKKRRTKITLVSLTVLLAVDIV